jgi:hypothetical protein
MLKRARKPRMIDTLKFIDYEVPIVDVKDTEIIFTCLTKFCTAISLKNKCCNFNVFRLWNNELYTPVPAKEYHSYKEDDIKPYIPDDVDFDTLKNKGVRVSKINDDINKLLSIKNDKNEVMHSRLINIEYNNPFPELMNYIQGSQYQNLYANIVIEEIKNINQVLSSEEDYWKKELKKELQNFIVIGDILYRKGMKAWNATISYKQNELITYMTNNLNSYNFLFPIAIADAYKELRSSNILHEINLFRTNNIKKFDYNKYICFTDILKNMILNLTRKDHDNRIDIDIRGWKHTNYRLFNDLKQLLINKDNETILEESCNNLINYIDNPTDNDQMLMVLYQFRKSLDLLRPKSLETKKEMVDLSILYINNIIENAIS